MNQQVTRLPKYYKPAMMTVTSLQDALEDIRCGTYKDVIASLRSHPKGSDEANVIKNNLSAFAIGAFNNGVANVNYVEDSSEVVNGDIDNLEPSKISFYKSKLAENPYIAYAFNSPSGNGLKVGVKVSSIKNDVHLKQIFSIVEKLLLSIDPALKLDPACNNISRLCYLSYDKDTYSNLDQIIALGGTEFDASLVIDVVAVLPSVLNGELVTATAQDRETCIAKITAMLEKSADGEHHTNRIKVAKLAGGYVAGGLIDKAEIMDIIMQISDTLDPSGTTPHKEIATIYSAFEIGLKTPIYSVSSDFDKHSSEDEWKLLLADHVTQWNLDNFSTILGGSHRIGRWEDPEASADNVRTLKYYTSEALSKVHANTLIQTGIKTVAGTKYPVYSNHFEAWYKNTKSASHTGGVIFLPSNKPVPPRDISSKYYNTWEGYSVNPVQNDEVLTRLRYHIMEVICSGDESLYNYIYKWFAYIFQYPELPAGSAIVLRGLEGAGKGVLGSFIQSLWGIHGVKIGSSKHLTGSFNALLADACFTFADEAFFSGDRQQADVLKGLVTESTFNIERKGVDTVAQTNYLKIFMSTNSDYAVPAGKDSRRYFVTDVSPKYLNDKSYFDPLVADCKSEAVKSAFLYDMLNMDLTGWSTSQIPDSEGLRNQRYHSMDTVKKWFVDVLIKGTVKGDFDNESGDYWDDKVSSEDLFTNYLRWCDQAKAGEYKRLVQCELVKYLSKIFSSARDVGGRGKRGIIFGNLTNAIDKFESYEKIFIHELTSDTAF